MASHLERTVYLNGQFLSGKDATISIFDRGFLFADSVYEGLGILDGYVVDSNLHWERLQRSLGEIQISPPFDRSEFDRICEGLIAQNQVDEAFLYIQVTRGTADRDYIWNKGSACTVVAFVQPIENSEAGPTRSGQAIYSHRDLRWKRRDIKTTNLLGQVLAKNFAHEHGGYEALLVDDEGFVTECGAASFFLVQGRSILCHPVSEEILNGVTRRSMMAAAEEIGVKLEIRRFILTDCYEADEAFLTGASSNLVPVTSIDGRKIGNGEPGPVTLAVREAYLKAVRST